jgi:hypothetical protein
MGPHGAKPHPPRSPPLPRRATARRSASSSGERSPSLPAHLHGRRLEEQSPRPAGVPVGRTWLINTGQEAAAQRAPPRRVQCRAEGNRPLGDGRLRPNPRGGSERREGQHLRRHPISRVSRLAQMARLMIGLSRTLTSSTAGLNMSYLCDGRTNPRAASKGNPLKTLTDSHSPVADQAGRSSGIIGRRRRRSG